jgi:ADP-heptose:LPS heptosyltransferase
MSEAILVICPRRPARFVLAMAALAALRAHHKSARLIGLVTPATRALARALPHLDELWLDTRASGWDFRATWELRAELRAATFARVYDFDQSAAARLCFRLMHGWRPAPEKLKNIGWSGDVVGTALFHDNPAKTGMHITDRLRDQLRAAGVLEYLPADVSWAARQVREFSAPFRMNQPFAMLCLDSETAEQWPVERYAALAEWLSARKLTPLLVGFTAHPDLAERIMQRCPDVIDITGQAPVIDTVFLAWAAAAAIGGDCALMHLAAVAHCRCVVLYGAGSDPATTGPRGRQVQVLSRPRMAEIATPEILTILGDLGAGTA